MMAEYPFITAVSASVFLAMSAGLALFRLRRRKAWAQWLLWGTTAAALLIDGVYFGKFLADHGVEDAFRRGFHSTLLLAMLMTIMAAATHLHPTLRGLDGILFLFATIIQLASLFLLQRPETRNFGRPWFASHTVAFQLSAACFLAAGSSGLIYLLVHYTLRRHRPSRLLGTVASLEALERFGRWMLLIGFPLFTFGVLTGLCGLAHLQQAGESYHHDPLAIFSIATWLIYAAAVTCVWLVPRIRGRIGAMLSALGMLLIVFGYLVVRLVWPAHM